MLERLFSSQTRVRLLELFLLQPEREVHVREICRITGLNINAVRRELANLEDLGLLRNRRAGNALFYTVNIAYPIYQELAGIIVKMGKAPMERKL